MRWLFIYCLICLVLPLQVLANEESPDQEVAAKVAAEEEVEIREEDEAVIAELELIELLELLENMNALASMEDSE